MEIEELRARRRAAKKRWQAAHPEHARQCKREQLLRWRAAHPDHWRSYMREKMQQYRGADPEKHRAQGRAHDKRRRTANPKRSGIWKRIRRKQCPPWANRQAIEAFYFACPEGMEVDHIVPLTGTTLEGYRISGLHVLWNLQYLPQRKNAAKRGHMRPEDQALCCA